MVKGDGLKSKGELRLGWLGHFPYLAMVCNGRGQQQLTISIYPYISKKQKLSIFLLYDHLVVHKRKI